jgi:hypothetical protein
MRDFAPVYPGSWVFFISFIFLVLYIMLNLFIGACVCVLEANHKRCCWRTLPQC